MTKAVGLLVEGFSYIGKSSCPRFEPLSRTPFLDSRRVLSDRAARVVDSVGRSEEGGVLVMPPKRREPQVSEVPTLRPY